LSRQNNPVLVLRGNSPLLYFYALSSIDWHTIPDLVRHINWYFFPLIPLATAISYWAAGESFVYVCRIFSFTTKAPIIWRVGFLSTIADNIAFLGNVGGHSVRILLLSKFDHNRTEVFAASVFAGYFYQIIFIAFFPLSFLLLALSHNQSPFGTITLLGLALFFTLLSVGLTITLFHDLSRRRLLHFVGLVVRKIVRRDISHTLQSLDRALTVGIRDSKARSGLLRKVILLTIVDWVLDVCTLELCLLTLGSFVNLGGLLLGFVVSVTLGALSFVPGGLGVQDGSMIGIYTLLGVPFRTSVLAVILSRIMYSFIPYFLSIFVYQDVVRQAAKKAT
jgi:uncharacterized protein (TIRG00374 family)